MSTSGGKRISEVMDKAGRRLAVIYRRTAELKLDPNNPRTHTPRQIKQIARSIETFGFIVPAVVDADGNIIAGHGRIFAALQLGLTEVPTISVDHLSKAQIKAFQIADNRLTENSTWNERLLGEQFKFLAESELDFSLEVTGFDDAQRSTCTSRGWQGNRKMTIPPMPCPRNQGQSSPTPATSGC